MPRRLRQHLIPTILLLASTAVFFWPVVLGSFTPQGERWSIPQGGGDLVSFLWPTYRFAAQTLRAGDVPLWNPYLYSGAPFVADNQSGVFYPPNLALALLPDVPYVAMEWLVVLHVFFAGMGMYLLGVTEFAGARVSAIVAALAFMFSSVFVTHVGNLNIVAVSAWLPWLFLTVRRLAVTRQMRWAVALGLGAGVSALAGHAQMSLVVGMGVALAFAWELAAARRRQLVLLGLQAFLIAAGVSALAVFPAIEMTRHTARAALSYAEASRYSLPPLGLGELATPLLFGRGARDFWPPWERVELGYAGLIALLLAGLAVRERARKYLYLTVGLVGLAIALGQHTPFHRLLFEYVPSFGQVRVPARFVLLTDFGLAYLAGRGLADWRARAVLRRRLFMWSALLVGLVLIGLPVVWRAVRDSSGGGSPPTLVPSLAVAAATLGAALLLGWQRRWRLLAGALAIELIALGAWVEIDHADPDAGYRAGPAVEFLRAQPGPLRIDVATTVWQPDAPATYRLEAVGGISNPLALAAYDAYYWSVGYRGSPQYNFLNAKYLVANKDLPAADASFVPVFNEDPEVDVYLNTNALPRIHLVDHVISVDGPAQAFEAVHAPDFDPTRQVILEQVEWGVPAPAELRGERNLFYLDYKPNSHAVAVQTPSDAILVFGEVWYPGWRAHVDGSETEVMRANYAFRAVPVPAGEHIVTMTFQPTIWATGLAVTLVTVGALLVAGAWQVRRATAHRHSPQT